MFECLDITFWSIYEYKNVADVFSPTPTPRKKEKKLHQKNTSVEFFPMDESILSFYVYADFPVREFPCMVLCCVFLLYGPFGLI